MSYGFIRVSWAAHERLGPEQSGTPGHSQAEENALTEPTDAVSPVQMTEALLKFKKLCCKITSLPGIYPPEIFHNILQSGHLPCGHLPVSNRKEGRKMD